jgi:sugar lactone lactonase YvrE
MDGFTLLASGFGSIEGPAIDDAGGLYFSDVPNGGVYRLSPNGLVETIVPRRKGVGGIVLHADGGIVVAGRDVSRVINGRTEVILSRADLPSEPLAPTGFNDMCADGQGRIFAGVLRRDATGEMGGYQLLMIEKPGAATAVDVGSGTLPNGAATSPDGRWLYHADTEAKSIAVLDLTDGSGIPTVRRRISTDAVPGGPDGMAVDVEGGIWAAMYQGGAIARFTPDGAVDRVIEVPARDALNLCFTGPDLEDIVVVTQDNTESPERAGSIFRTSVGVQGIPVGRARV